MATELTAGPTRNEFYSECLLETRFLTIDSRISSSFGYTNVHMFPANTRSILQPSKHSATF
jgi:hypothetical protein